MEELKMIPEQVLSWLQSSSQLPYSPQQYPKVSIIMEAPGTGGNGNIP